MDKIKMPWLEDLPTAPQESSSPPDISRAQGLLKTLRRHWVLPLLGLVLLALLAGTSNSKSEVLDREEKLVAMITKIPVFKGQDLEPVAIEMVQVSRSSLTKSQAWNLLQMDFQQYPEVRIMAAKDIAPMKPILWSDIKVLRSGARHSNDEITQRVQIHYPQKVNK